MNFCPECKSPGAYIGLVKIECPNTRCRFYTPHSTGAELVAPGGGPFRAPAPQLAPVGCSCKRPNLITLLGHAAGCKLSTPAIASPAAAPPAPIVAPRPSTPAGYRIHPGSPPSWRHPEMPTGDTELATAWTSDPLLLAAGSAGTLQTRPVYRPFRVESIALVVPDDFIHGIWLKDARISTEMALVELPAILLRSPGLGLWCGSVVLHDGHVASCQVVNNCPCVVPVVFVLFGRTSVLA